MSDPRRSLRGAAARTAVLAALLAASGCASLRSDQPLPAASVAVPASWSAPARADDAPAASAPGSTWWTQFRSAELDALVDAALAHNRDLQAARARLAQARARSASVAAAGAPQLGVAVGAARDKPADAPATGSFVADFRASYEIDAFGRIERGVAAADGRVAAGAFAVEGFRISLQAEVASQYFQALSARDRLALGERSLANAESTLALLQAQARGGAVSGLEVLRQRALVASVRSSLPPLQRTLQQSLGALAVLTGRPPQDLSLANGSSLAGLWLPAVDAGAPSALLRQRPDIRQAEAELGAAHAEVGAARAARWPTLTLSAEGSATSSSLAALLRSGTIGIAATLAATLVDGGRRRAEVGLAEGVRDEGLARYEQTLLVALREVEDSLAAVARSAEQAAHQQQAIEHARAALRLADLRYRNGAVDFSTVLDAQRVLLAAEDALEATTLARFVAAVGLARALGGGWEPASVAALAPAAAAGR